MPKKSNVTRRDFLKTTGKTTAGLAALRGITMLTNPEKVFGANDRVRVAVCGLRNRGNDHLHSFSRVPNVEIAALCDVDQSILNKRRGEVGGNAQLSWMFANCSRINPSMQSRLPRRTTGIL